MDILFIVIFICSCSAVPLIIYDNASFEPTIASMLLGNLSSILSRDQCACQYYSHPYCLTTIYSGIDQQCSLFFARPQQGGLHVTVMMNGSSVMYFTNKTLPPPSLLTSTNETIYGIWNTTAGGNSMPSSVGYQVGNYYPGEEPQKALDQSTATKYTSFGINNNSLAALQYGLNTGLYLTLQRGMSLLVGIRFCTGNDHLPRDPFTITIEGSNQRSTTLRYGSSWSLIYNDTTGLQSVTDRSQCGAIQYMPYKSMWYTSYRILVTSKRGNATSTQYSEIELLGY